MMKLICAIPQIKRDTEIYCKVFTGDLLYLSYSKVLTTKISPNPIAT